MGIGRRALSGAVVAACLATAGCGDEVDGAEGDAGVDVGAVDTKETKDATLLDALAEVIGGDAAGDAAGKPDAATPGQDAAGDPDGASAPDETSAPDVAVQTDEGGTPDATAVPDVPATPDATETADAGQDTGVTDPPVPVVRFVAVGDTGKGNEGQYLVGKAIADKCAKDGCDYVLLLGDNFYDTGVKDVDDPQFQSKFEGPYADIDVPILVSLGNHDYGGEGAGYELWKAEHYLDYSEINPQFYFPDNFYDFVEGHVHFFALDSNLMMYGLGQDQANYFPKRIAESQATWKIAFGHHPYLSNGKHGHAGEYESLPFVPIVNGEGVKKAYDAYLCGKVDVLIAGHDHSRQWLEQNSKCPGTELFVSGAGASTTEIKDESLFFKPVPAWFQDADKRGFLWVKIEGNSFYGEFIDDQGNVDFAREFTK